MQLTRGNKSDFFNNKIEGKWKNKRRKARGKNKPEFCYASGFKRISFSHSFLIKSFREGKSTMARMDRRGKLKGRNADEIQALGFLALLEAFVLWGGEVF